MGKLSFERVDFKSIVHRKALVKLLNDYMMDDMGSNKPFDPKMHDLVLSDLENHPSYIGFLLGDETNFVALANCFVNYSTFRAKQLLNIHDFVVATEARGQGFGKDLLEGIISYCKSKDYCRINLEVREDNVKAKSLYQKLGFAECDPRMFFWEKDL